MGTANDTALQTLTENELEQFHRDGFYIRRQVFAADEIALIRDTFMASNDAGHIPGLSDTAARAKGPNQKYDAADPLAKYPRMMHPHRFQDNPVGPVALKYLLDKRLEACLTDLFGDEPIAAQTMFYFKPPGSRGQDFHQDNFYLRVKPGNCLAAWVAIDDCDAENGAMMVVPTSNKLDLVCPEKADSTLFFTTEHVPIPQNMTPVTAVLKAGDVLFFDGSLIHGSFPNTSKTRFRRSFICHYVPRGCIEVGQYYRPLLHFNGETTDRTIAQGGGPCGALQDTIKGPH